MDERQLRAVNVIRYGRYGNELMRRGFRPLRAHNSPPFGTQRTVKFSLSVKVWWRQRKGVFGAPAIEIRAL